MSAHLVISIACDCCAGIVSEFISSSAIYEVAAADARREGWSDDGPLDWCCPECRNAHDVETAPEADTDAPTPPNQIELASFKFDADPVSFARDFERALRSSVRSDPQLPPDRRDLNGLDSPQKLACKINVERSGSGNPCGPFTVADPGPTFELELSGDRLRDLLDLALAAFDREGSSGAEHRDVCGHVDSSVSGEAVTSPEATVEASSPRGDDSRPAGRGVRLPSEALDELAVILVELRALVDRTSEDVPQSIATIRQAARWLTLAAGNDQTSPKITYNNTGLVEAYRVARVLIGGEHR